MRQVRQTEKDDAGKLVTAFAAVKLDQDATTIGVVIDIALEGGI